MTSPVTSSEEKTVTKAISREEAENNRERAARSAFYSGLFETIRKKGSVASFSSSDSILVNGISIPLGVYPVMEGGGSFFVGGWTGTHQATLRGVDNGRGKSANKVWRTRKDGWRFDEIADWVIARAGLVAQARTREKEARESADEIASNPEWTALVKKARLMNVTPYLSLGKVKFTVEGLSLEQAKVVIEALSTVVPSDGFEEMT